MANETKEKTTIKSDFNVFDGLNPNQREWIRSGIEGTADFAKYNNILPSNEKIECIQTLSSSGGNQTKVKDYLKAYQQREVVEQRKIQSERLKHAHLKNKRTK